MLTHEYLLSPHAWALQGMPHKVYHGRTGVVWNVTKRSVGVEVNKQVRTMIIYCAVILQICSLSVRSPPANICLGNAACLLLVTPPCTSVGASTCPPLQRPEPLPHSEGSIRACIRHRLPVSAERGERL